MKREAATLRTGMVQTYRSAFPKETVILDPLAQMHKKIDQAQRNAGRAEPDDFGSSPQISPKCWRPNIRPRAVARTASPIASIEYRERNLLVRVKPDSKLSHGKGEGCAGDAQSEPEQPVEWRVADRERPMKTVLLSAANESAATFWNGT